MITRTPPLFLFTLVLVMTPVFGSDFEELLQSSPSQQRQQAIQQLRKLGPTGLEIALGVLDDCRTELLRCDDASRYDSIQQSLANCQQAVDAVAAQRYATISRLYWYTDLEEAKRAAAESGKPILSLRMLGNLTDELSCANSRFFRTTLYANAEISDFLREKFILHWQSMRPVPVVTIDFGDGRTMRRTITGNSAHLALHASGQPFDVLPGLYGPAAFAEWLERIAVLNQARRDFVSRNMLVGDDPLAYYHRDRLQAISQARRDDLAAVAPKLAQDEPIDDALWQQIAARHLADAALDASSIGLIRETHAFPTATQAAQRAASKSTVEDPIVNVVENFQQAAAVDTLRNEYLLHRQIHQWFVDGAAVTQNEAELTERVYAELFLTPSSDPWLGLAPPDVYCALEGGGLEEDVR